MKNCWLQSYNIKGEKGQKDNLQTELENTLKAIVKKIL